MKDKLIELLSSCPTDPEGNRNVAVIAQHLLDNGVVVFDNDVVSPENRPLIQTVAGMPVNEVIDLVKAKQEGRIIVPPCKVGDTVYYNLGKNASLPFGTRRTIALPVGAIASMKYKKDWFVRTEFGGAIGDFYFSDFGKTVFLTREKAEKALKEYESDA
ncbi:MAG: hypothetical protein IKK09_01595 [Clostridia bacterium]|nr:hypothetical protein [Clostridia bacterium]